ncbi:hypothetical protein HDC37_001425 [Microbacterium sp. AK009]|uniref:hypothetical protein n=1 Tax=Microbacterium sp. AK009 TaxID=2723068 RepID=UPI0015CA6600|nr:hypothetical protein [Microbacterium sp. AK009]NYF16600.1 hypothetical protein [Microbacterium sp. AK009]
MQELQQLARPERVVPAIEVLVEHPERIQLLGAARPVALATREQLIFAGEQIQL